MFGPDVEAAIRRHALEAFPNEACGLVVDGVYQPAENIAENPHEAFDMDRLLLLQPGVQAVVHSHPNGPDYPTRSDMEQQIATGLPYGLCWTDGETCSGVMWWGPGVPTPPLIGRSFRHGPSGSDGKGDCCALLRDWYAQHRGVLLDECPRDHGWWLPPDDPHTPGPGLNLYLENYAQNGFTQVALQEVKEGDVLLMSLTGKAMEHSAIYIGRSLILHHLPGRLSRDEPLGRWRNHISMVLRHDGVTKRAP